MTKSNQLLPKNLFISCIVDDADLLNRALSSLNRFTCILDPMPSNCLCLLDNSLSLQTSCFPAAFKTILAHTILRKSTLDVCIIKKTYLHKPGIPSANN